ncbi:siderophore-interacting protein [Pseudaestuariivita rosea]|uniref:siderophore-interacting protein n=1 Tax=Pseudaestuariivita rosea TaxID=2763263 RepID=UPI001ABA0AA5|nr:siderophore-interacting protein [Pseudaestuariivita rosea]
MSFVDTQTLVSTENPDEILAEFVHHLEDDHDIQFQKMHDGSRVVEQEAFRVAFRVELDGLSVSIRAPNEGALVFFKEEIARHISEIDAIAAKGIRWSGEASREGELPPNFNVLTVVSSLEIFPGMQRVTLKMPGLKDVLEDGLHLKLMLPANPGRTAVWPKMAANGAPVWPEGKDALHARYMTIVQIRPDVEEIDLDMVRHGDGLISRWAQKASIDDEVGAMGPAGMQGLPKAERYLMAADMTGLSSAARIMERLPKNATGAVIVAAPTQCDLAEYLPASNLTIYRIAPEDFEEDVIPLLGQLAAVVRPEQAWFAGEFTNAQAARKLFRQNGLSKGTQLSVAYWRRNQPGFMA